MSTPHASHKKCKQSQSRAKKKRPTKPKHGPKKSQRSQSTSPKTANEAKAHAQKSQRCQNSSQKRPMMARCGGRKLATGCYWVHFCPSNHELRCFFPAPLAELFPPADSNELGPQPPTMRSSPPAFLPCRGRGGSELCCYEALGSMKCTRQPSNRCKYHLCWNERNTLMTNLAAWE